MNDVNETQWGSINQTSNWDAKHQRPERAFPSTFKSMSGEEQVHAWGMTLRDYFAAKAMQGLLACPQGDGTKESYAKWVYEYADAMLKAREQ
jgi:hypothetical protein